MKPLTHKQLDDLADALLLRIRKKTGVPIPREKLTAGLKIDLPTLDAAVKLLASCDYRIRASRKTITYVSAPDSLTATEISFGLKTEKFGRTVYAHNSVKSTNDIALALADDGAPEGTIVTAEQQTRGRGRLGRSWFSPAGVNVYISIILRPKFQPEQAPALSIIAAVALADTVSEFVPGDVRIKWPNDLMIGRRKTAGILTELSAEKGKINHVVAGIGINVNQGVGSFPEDIRDSATSLRRAVKRKINRVELVQKFLARFEKEYKTYCRYGLRKQLPRIRKYSYLIGKTISVKSGRIKLSGKAIDIDVQGRLVIDTGSEQTHLSAGEVTIVKE